MILLVKVLVSAMTHLAVMKTLQMFTAGRLWTTLTMTLISWSLISIHSDPLKSTWLVSNLQHTPTQSKLSPLACLHTPYAGFFYARTQALVPQWDKCLDMKGDNVEV